MTRKQTSCLYFQPEYGYSCAQAVFLPFAENSGLSRESAAKLSAAFGGGVGGLEQTCGALCGAAMALALAVHPADPKDGQKKANYRKTMQQMGRAFEEKFGSMQCCELKAMDQNRPQPVDGSRPCTKYVSFCAEYLESLI